MGLQVRPARPEDAAGISLVHRCSVSNWYRFPPEGLPVPTPWEDLSDVERWRNGGPWVIPMLCQAHLDRLLDDGGYAWVGLLDGEIVGEAEAFLNEEPPPLDRYLNLSVLYVHPRAQRRGVGQALMAAALSLARDEQCLTVLIGDVARGARPFYTRSGFSRWQKMILARAACPMGEAQGEPVDPPNYARGAGLPMPIGRYQGAGQEWERLRGPALLPEGLSPPRRDWRRIRSAGRTAWAAFAQNLVDPSYGSVRAWSDLPLDDLVPLLLVEAAALGYEQANLLLAAPDFDRLLESIHLTQINQQEAWWRRLAGR